MSLHVVSFSPMRTIVCVLRVDVRRPTAGLNEGTARYIVRLANEASIEPWGADKHMSNEPLDVRDTRSKTDMTRAAENGDPYCMGPRWAKLMPDCCDHVLASRARSRLNSESSSAWRVRCRDAGGPGAIAAGAIVLLACRDMTIWCYRGHHAHHPLARHTAKAHPHQAGHSLSAADSTLGSTGCF